MQTTEFAGSRLTRLEHSVEDWKEAVAELEKYEVWKHYPSEERPYGSREAFFLGEFGKPEPELTEDKKRQQLLIHGGDRHSVEFKEALELRRMGGDRKSEDFREGNSQDSNTTLRIGRGNAYIRARLERDAADTKHPDRQEIAARLLPRVESGELSPHAAAVEAGWRKRLVQLAPTVEGFVHGAQQHLSPKERLQLKEAL